MRNSVFEELRERRFADIQEEICCREVWKWAILESKLSELFTKNITKANKHRENLRVSASEMYMTIFVEYEHDHFDVGLT